MEIVFATRNLHKIREFNEILEGTPIAVVRVPEGAPDVEETGDTFLANAILKAVSAYRFTGRPALADDSGLCVDALGGAPGVHSARYAGGLGDEANNDKLVRELARVAPTPDGDRKAHYECVLALACPVEWLSIPLLDGVRREPSGDSTHAIVYAEGRADGTIIDTPRGDGGFGYDPYFQVVGAPRTMAELSADEKHAISHRGAAMRALAGWLRGIPTAQSEAGS